MNITIGRGNARQSAVVLSGKFARGSREAIACERTSEDIKQYLSQRDPSFRKRSAKPHN